MTTAAMPIDATGLARRARDAGVLFERCAALADVALSALDAGGLSTLAGAMLERDRVLAQLAPIVAELAAAREAVAHRPAHAADVHRLDTHLQPVEEAGRHAFAIQARLIARLEERRQDVRRDLDRLKQAGQAHQAYGRGPVREFRRIDRET